MLLYYYCHQCLKTLPNRQSASVHWIVGKEVNQMQASHDVKRYNVQQSVGFSDLPPPTMPRPFLTNSKQQQSDCGSFS